MAKKQKIGSTEGKKEAASSRGKAYSPDKLTKAGKKGEVELTEDDLKAVSGGAVDYFKSET
jgi:hypothetical protein